MNSIKANLLENQLRQKLIHFENALARISDTRKHLRDNADLVKNEIRASFGTQLTQIRRREQQLLETLDTVASVKDGILSEQQDQLHQALGACMQGLEWYQTAVEDMKESRLSSIDTVEHHINDVLKKLSVIDVKPRETAALSFEADSLALRKAISSFGHVRNGKGTPAKSFESLPAQLEDYDDEQDVVHSLLHKAVHRNAKAAATIFIGRPQLSNDPKDWLLREALTGHHSEPPTPEHEHSHSTTPFLRHCSTAAVLTGTNGSADGRQGQVHSWLHQIKNQVEVEPNVFEDFEIVKDQDSVKGSITFDAIKAELSGDVAAAFRPYFDAVLRSPANQWLLKSMEKMDLSTLTSDGKGGNLNVDASVKYVAYGADTDDMESCPSTITYASSGPEFDAGTGLMQDGYAKLWRQFVDTLWNTTDSLWILPCSSDEKPQPLSNTITGDTNFVDLNPIIHARLAECRAPPTVVNEIVENLIFNWVDTMKITENRNQFLDQWLLKSDSEKAEHVSTNFFGGKTPLNPEPCPNFDEWIGWKTLLEKQRKIGNHGWLLPSQREESLHFHLGTANLAPSGMEF